MLSNALKKRKMKTILRDLALTPSSDMPALALHKLLIEDCEGKLCRYMPIKEYTIPSLQNHTVHISSPMVFNDPFDCKIGIDIQSIIEAIIPTEQMELYINDFTSVKNREIELESVPDERRPIISRWINNRNLTNFINVNQGKILTNDEVTSLLFNNFDLVGEIVVPMITSIASRNGMPLNSDIIQLLLDHLPEDAKRQLIENNGSYSGFIRGLGVSDDVDEIGLTEKACEKLDPENAEALRKIKEIFDMLEQKINTELCSLFRVCCLCTDHKNKLMWSHYADGHKGICVEYDFSELKENGIQPLPVIYSKNRIKIPWKEVINQSTGIQSHATGHFIEALLTKDKMWEYEREWRILVPANFRNDDISAPPIKCIYLGALCSDENANKFIAVAKKLNTPIKRMTVDRGEFELHATSM